MLMPASDSDLGGPNASVERLARRGSPRSRERDRARPPYEQELVVIILARWYFIQLLRVIKSRYLSALHKELAEPSGKALCVIPCLDPPRMRDPSHDSQLGYLYLNHTLFIAYRCDLEKVLSPEIFLKNTKGQTTVRRRPVEVAAERRI